MMAAEYIQVIDGRALPLRGDDIDTDRIMPARFSKSMTLRGLEQHVFEDDRREAERAGHGIRSTNPAYRARRSCSSTGISAADRRASTRRRGCIAGASARSSASRSPRSSSATRS